MSDEDVGLQIEPEADFDWAELESSMTKKGLLRAAPKPASHTISVPNKRRLSSAGVSEAKAAKQHQIDSQADDPAPSSQQKSKRVIKTAEASAAVPRKAQSVPMDETGRPILPVTCGIVTVHDLGQVISDRQPFHNKRYIWPVGFKSSRQYMSAVDPEANVTYYSEIKDGGSAPVFEVWAEDAPEQKYQSSTSTGVWTSVFKAAAAIRGKDASNSASGPDFYGFSNNTIAMLIETLPGVENCLNYQKKNFELIAAPAPRMRASVSMPKLDSTMTNGEQDVDVEAEETNEGELEGEQEEEAVIDLFELAARAIQHQQDNQDHN